MRQPGPQEVWETTIGSLYRVLLVDGPTVVTVVEWNANDYTRDEFPIGMIRRFTSGNWHDFFRYAPEWNG